MRRIRVLGLPRFSRAARARSATLTAKPSNLLDGGHAQLIQPLDGLPDGALSSSGGSSRACTSVSSALHELKGLPWRVDGWHDRVCLVLVLVLLLQRTLYARTCASLVKVYRKRLPQWQKSELMMNRLAGSAR